MAAEDLGFAYAERKSGEVAIARDGRVIVVLRRAAAVRFLEDVTNHDPQGVMARATGNYRRGNERQAREHPRNR